MQLALIEATADVLASVARPEEALGAEARARADAFLRPALREDFVAARVLARRLVARALGVAPDEVELAQRCADCGGPHGRPLVRGAPQVRVSWSHDAGWVAAGVSARDCGIDVVALPPPGGRDGTSYPVAALSPAERRWCADAPDPARAFARLWARKEALVKSGYGTLDEVATLSVLDTVHDTVFAEGGAGTAYGRRIVEVAAPAGAAARVVGAWARLDPGAL